MNWKIKNMKRLTTQHPGFVVEVFWEALKSDGDINAINYGSVTFEFDEQNPEYIPFDELTEEIVLSWVKNVLEEEKIEISLDAEIQSQKQPKEIFGLPWDK